MNYDMKLRPRPFSQIRTGAKTIELRLNDEKRRQLQVGDTITFSNTEISALKLYTHITALHVFPSFEELFRTLPMTACGKEPDMTVEAAVETMREYYPAEKEAKYGALGIEIEVLEEESDWTKACASRGIDVPGFLQRMERIKQGEDNLCPFCGGSVRLTESADGRNVYACDSCDMTIKTEQNSETL